MTDGLTISGLTITHLKQIGDERGAVYHFMNSDSHTFKGFGEAYFSKINTGVVKGWKFHHEAFQNFCVPFGRIKIVVFDNREGFESKGMINEIVLDDANNYTLLSMPPGLWYSFKCESESFSLLANIIDIKHDPKESQNLPLDTKKIPYDWGH